MDILSGRMKENNTKFELVKDQSKFLQNLNIYLQRLMTYLWEKPEIVAAILKKAGADELKELAPLFGNNFYENILSSNYIEDNLMYLLTLLLKDEINNLTNINQECNFLKNTPCGSILNELKRKNDIQIFFKTIILSLIENLEVNYSNYNISFNIENLTKEYDNKSKLHSKKEKKLKRDQGYLKYPNDKEYSDSISLDDNNNDKYSKENKDQENFNKKYIPSLDKKTLLKVIEDNKNNKNMYDYCYSKINDCNSDEKYYSNEKLMNNLYDSKFSQELLLKYKDNFMAVISFINSIIENILNNFHLLPYSVKSLCKIISLLITQKFPKINEYEKNAFIAKFFFGKLLIPILQNPAIEVFINNFIISEVTSYNLKIICKILEKFTSGCFFISNNETSDYTPFNWYFIEKMGKLFEIFGRIMKVKLPNFIEQLITNELPSDYVYNYFKENPNEIINHISICFNLSQVQAIVNIIENNKKEIFKEETTTTIKLQKTMEKLNLNKKILNDLINKEKIDNKKNPPLQARKSKKKEKEEKVKEPEKVVQHYFLFTNLITNERYNKLMDIVQETPNFSIKELEINNPNEESIMKNNIIKVKNFFCSLLYNYDKLVKTDFDEGTTENTVKILNELNNFIKSSNFVVNNSIPFNWYVNSLLEYLKKIPENLTNNDCEELYNEIENDLNKSIKELDFEALSIIKGKLKFSIRDKTYYEESIKLLNDIRSNEETKVIIENEIIPFEIKFNLDDENMNNSIFEIIPSNSKEKDRSSEEKIKEYEKSKGVKLCLTIDSFTKKFPNLVKYQELQDADIFEYQSILRFPEKLNNYFNQVEKYILENKRRIEIKSIKEKIYDYVMGKIYDKIYPSEPYDQDNKIFQHSIRLSWTEPKHFIKSKRNFVLGNFLNDIKKYFKLFDLEKSPRKKILRISQIFNSINYLISFNNSKKEVGVDDSLSILNYSCIKAQPIRLFSNAKFVELYIGDKKDKQEESYLSQILGICIVIPQTEYSKLNGVTREEFIKRCNEETKKDTKIGHDF